MNSRRDFFRIVGRTLTAAGAAGAAGLTRMPLAAQTTDYRALVCVFLFGGNDSGNTLVPLGGPEFSAYTEARGSLALSQSLLLPVSTAGGKPFGFNSGMPEMRDLFNQRKLAAVANVGTLVRPLTKLAYQQRTTAIPNNLFSHSDQQLQWQNVNFGSGYTTGWGGRTADRLRSLNAMRRVPGAFSVSGNQVFCIGESGERPATLSPGVEPGLLSTGTQDTSARLQAFRDLLALSSGATLMKEAAETTSEGLRQADVLKSSLAARTALRTAFPKSELGDQLKQIAEVISIRQGLGVSRQVFFCSLGGFDTHVGQASKHKELLAQVSAAVKAFYDATVELGVDQKVTTFTHSEFGRTLLPSTGGGSDHAWGGHQFVIGGAVKGGDIYGQFPTLENGGPDDAGNRGVLIPTTSVDQYVATLASWAGVTSSDISTMLPNLANFHTRNLGFMI